jgi:Fur family ferric uptake transcriptional regulator
VADGLALNARLTDYIQSRGLKNTRQRRQILEVLAEAEGHVSLDDLLALVQQKMAGVGYATVYRTMKLLVEADVAHEHRFGDGQTRYEAAAIGEHDHHDHIICVNCGHIIEFHNEEIERLQDVEVESRGLEVVSHRHEIFVSCKGGRPCSERVPK